MSDQSLGEYDKSKQFYARLGFCISRWAYIERELYQISKWALGCSDTLATYVFYQWSSFENKIKYVDGLLERAASKQARSEWKGLNSNIKALAIDRNFIVHQPAAVASHHRINISTGAVESELEQHIIRTEPLEVRAGKRKDRVITSDDLVKHIIALNALSRHLVDFSGRLLRSRRQLAKSAPPKKPPNSARAKNRRAKAQAL